MPKVNKITNEIETLAPLELSAEWDNSGWQVHLGDYNTNAVMLALSPTLDVINQAIERNCGLVITHHPLIFSKINKLDAKNPIQNTLIKAIQNNIQIYSAHTNLDVTTGGIADILCEKLNLKNISTIAEFAKIGELISEQRLDTFLARLKEILNIKTLKIINPTGKTMIKRVALCPGSGGDLIQHVKEADIYITSDIKYHNAIEVDNMIVIDAGHFETEKIILPELQKHLNSLFTDLEVFLAEEPSPWELV